MQYIIIYPGVKIGLLLHERQTRECNIKCVRKALYLRIKELQKKWNGRPVPNWALVRNQLAMDDKIQARILKYENC